jgi:hypothetical protein
MLQKRGANASDRIWRLQLRVDLVALSDCGFPTLHNIVTQDTKRGNSEKDNSCGFFPTSSMSTKKALSRGNMSEKDHNCVFPAPLNKHRHLSKTGDRRSANATSCSTATRIK